MERELMRKLAYTVEEAAELLSLSRAHLYRLIDLQEIGSVTIGRSRRITAKQLQAFINSLESGSSKPATIKALLENHGNRSGQTARPIATKPI